MGAGKKYATYLALSEGADQNLYAWQERTADAKLLPSQERERDLVLLLGVVAAVVFLPGIVRNTWG